MFLYSVLPFFFCVSGQRIHPGIRPGLCPTADQESKLQVHPVENDVSLIFVD